MDSACDQIKDGALLGGRYQCQKLLNKGSFGMVYLAKDTINNERVAVKCLVKPGSPAAATYGLAVDEFNEELLFHTKLGSHPHIVDLLDHFEDENHNFLVLEFCPEGDLYEAISEGTAPVSTEHIRTFMLQLVDALEYMHSRGVYHRDLKPENIFLDKNGDPKIGDFGLATTEEITEESAVGSNRYMAPEQYDAIGGYEPRKADIWALGICMLNILFARNPFNVPTESDPVFADFVLDRESLFDHFPSMSNDTFEVLINCLQLDPHKRSLEAVRDAIERVVSWTIDDEEFTPAASEERTVTPTCTEREPIRTPSLQTPHVAVGNPFPWAQALQQTPMQRQLSSIADNEEFDQHRPVQWSEDMYKGRPQEYHNEMGGYFNHHPASFDSGLGASFSSFPRANAFRLHFDGSKIKHQPAQAMPIASKPLKQEDVFGKSAASTSWSDWLDEDEEEEELERQQKAEREARKFDWSEEDPGFDEEIDNGYDIEWVGGGWDDLTV